MSAFIGLDIGTTSVKAAAFDDRGHLLGKQMVPLRLHKHNARKEQYPEDWWKASLAVLKDLQNDLTLKGMKISSIGLTGQCPTFTLVDENGEHMEEALLYSDNRGVEELETFLQEHSSRQVHRVTGQLPSPFYILPKLMWLSKFHPFLQAKRELFVMQPRDYVGWRLTGEKVTDPTHAACTMLYDIAGQRWLTEWLDATQLSKIQLPPVLPSTAIQGYLSAEASLNTGIPEGTPIVVGGADSLCAVHASCIVEKGIACDISGTSTCVHWLVDEPSVDLSVNTYPHVVAGQYCAEIKRMYGRCRWM